MPSVRNEPLEIGAPEIARPHDLLTAMALVTNAVFAGDATTQEGAATAKVLKAHLEAIQTIDHEERLTVLEKDLKGGR